MGKTYSHMVKRPLKNWNIEDRAMRQLDRTEKKATPAPRHPGSHKYIDNVTKDHPEVVQQVKGSNDQLVANMASLLATPEKQSEIISKRAKRVRKTESAEDFGYEEPEVLSDGKISIKHTMNFLSKNQENPEKYNVEYLASEYKLDTDTATRMMKYYQLFQLYTPEPKAGRQHLKQSKTSDKLIDESKGG